MKRAEYLAYHKAACDKMVEITAKKNADYTGGSGVDDAFSNFDCVAVWGVSPLDGFITRMSDKFARISTFVKKGALQVSDESVEDTLFDLANYCILMAGYIKAKKAEQAQVLIDANSGVKVDAEPVHRTVFQKLVGTP